MTISFKKILFLFCAVCIAACAVSCKKESNVPSAQLLQSSLDAAKKGDWEKCGKYSAIVCEREPENTSALILNALALENLGQEPEALDVIQRAALDRKSFMAQYSCGRMLYQRGKYEQALLPLKIAYDLNPDSVDCVLLLEQASAFCKTLNTREYCSILWKNFKHRFNNGRNPFVWNELGLYYAIRKDFRRAQQSFLRAEQISPDSPEIQLNLAVICDYMMNDRQKAIPYYEKYLRLTAGRSGLEMERLEVSRRLQEIR